MLTTKLSSKGQVIIPKSLRSRHHWETGQQLAVIDMCDGILLRTISPFQKSSLKEVVSCLSYAGPTRTIEKMEEAIKKGAKSEAHDLR